MSLLRDPTKNIDSFVRKYTEASSLISMHHFSASRYMDLRSASRSMSLHLSALAALSCTTSAQVATWISAAPVAPCLFICQRLPLCHAPLQRKSLHGPPQRQSLHVDSIHCQRLPLMLHFTRCSASRFTYLVSL